MSSENKYELGSANNPIEFPASSSTQLQSAWLDLTKTMRETADFLSRSATVFEMSLNALSSRSTTTVKMRLEAVEDHLRSLPDLIRSLASIDTKNPGA